MNKKFFRICSFILTFAILFNALPLHAFAAASDTEGRAEDSLELTDSSTEAYILEEVVENRTEYSKEFRLSNGLHMATVYAEPVHYQDNGSWVEIDNTLKLSSARSGNTYTNTAGSWQVSLPQNLTNNTAVSISKDGYTLSFYLSGELRSSGGEASISSSAEAAATAEIGDTTFALASAQTSSASLEEVDLSSVRESAEYPETVLDNLLSRLRYENVYPNTDIIYELDSMKLKESIVMAQYDATLHGYSYILDVGDMIPVLTDNNAIELYDETGKELIMYIPAPYLVDAAGESSYEVDVALEGSSSKYVLAYMLPQEWLADEERQWPVVLDPVVRAEETTGNIRDIAVYSKTYLSSENGILQCGYRSTWGLGRFYIKYKRLPVLTAADVIVSASLTLYKPYGSSNGSCTVEVHKVDSTWESETMTWSNKPDFDPIIEDYVLCQAAGYYSWDITDIARGWYAGENTGMMFKADDTAEAGTNTWKQFYSSDCDVSHLPSLNIIFRNNNGLENYWDYTASSAGRAGTGYINNYTGNLVWVHSDIGFGGNRMPVSISHIYNANDSMNNTFGMGNGWRTNFNQRVYQWATNTSYYVWEDSDGTAHYFLYDSTNTYIDEDGLELTLEIINNDDGKYRITDKYGNCSYFDTHGRLTTQVNNQEQPSSITVAYTTNSGYLISSVTDGAGREYTFTYDSGLLTRIRYLGSGETALSWVDFGYTDSNLTSVTDKDGEISRYTYTTNNLLNTVRDIDDYTLTYTYTTLEEGLPSRVHTIAETDGLATGGTLTLEYAQNQTTFTDQSGNVQIMQFNNWGNTISIQDDQGRAQYAQYAINDAATDGTATVAEDTTLKGNQLRLSSKLQNTVGNVLDNSSFESSTNWTATSSAVSASIVSGTAYFGSKSLALTRSAAGTAEGAHSASFSVSAGETYTFSAYVKTGSDSTAYLALSDGSTAVTSEVLAKNQDWTRLEVSYTATAAVTLTAQLLTENAGTVYMDCVQVEKAPTASRYNLIENGDFRYNTVWSSLTGHTTAAFEGIPQAPALELSANIYKLSGTCTTTNRISQTVNVSGQKNDVFVLAGWAKADSAPLDSFNAEAREFGLILTFNNTDNTTTKFTVRFNPYVDNWQYAAAPVVADKAYKSVTIDLAYDYNVNTAYFDGIQLYKEEFGSSYAYDENGNIKSVKDIQGQTTTYEYVDNDLTKAILPTGAELTYTYDDYHNVLTATTETGVTYTFTYDDWGNNTSVSITSGGKTISSTATYSTDGNRLLSTTDAAGKVTQYGYDADTNVLDWVQYPEDTEATRTVYTYDNMYRLASAAVTTDTGLNLSAEYTYADDLLASIETASTTYSFTYGDFALRSAVQIGERTLAEYTYTSRTNYLSVLDYGNGDKVQYTYDVQGRVTQQTYEDGDTITYRYDNNGALATVTDSATGIKTTYYYDFTDRLMKYVESDGINTHSVGYEYDTINNLTKLVETINGVTHETSYTYDLDNRVTEITTGDTTRTYAYDGYSRVSQQVTTHDGNTLVTTSYTYREPTDTTTTGQIASLGIDSAGYDVTYSYTYDDNGNILSVSDGTNTTSYVYDSAGQLVRENNQAANKTWVWTYDRAGNILTRAEYAYTTASLEGVTPTDTVNYTYGDDDWGDLLTAYDGVAISYDEIGNPLSDGTWTYTWEHGRELASMTDGTTTWTYTYNADGMRTTRSNGTATYKYVYNGSSLVQMTVGSDTLYFTDATVTYNNTVYYYVKNIQGDIVAILDTDGDAVVQYTYDAWGNILTTTGELATTLGAVNPLRYRGYVYDSETGLYYLQSRYYNPEVGRFLNADDTAYLGADGTPLSYNLFSYCSNNPVCCSDFNGNSPEWWQWAISGAMVVAGIALVATGVGGVAGGALISAGVNSIVGSYVSESLGGSSIAGWTGGMITGVACGIGAGFAGDLIMQATHAVGAACLGKLAASGAVAFGSGMLGSVAGQVTTAFIDGEEIDVPDLLESSIATGAVNCLSSLGSGMGSALRSMPLHSTTSTTLANSLHTAWSLFVEAVCDFLGTLPSVLP